MCLIVQGESGFYAGGTELLGNVKKQWKWRSGGTRETTSWEGGWLGDTGALRGQGVWRPGLEAGAGADDGMSNMNPRVCELLGLGRLQAPGHAHRQPCNEGSEVCEASDRD